LVAGFPLLVGLGDLQGSGAERAMSYLPWYVASGFLCLLMMSRILSNLYVKARHQEILMHGMKYGIIPLWVSALYMSGIVGLVASGIWSFAISWWAPIPVIAAYCLQMTIIPSGLFGAVQDARHAQASAAVQRAVTEMDSAMEQMKMAQRGGASSSEMEESIHRALEAVEQARPLIEAVRDPKKQMGLLMFLENHLNRFKALLEGRQNG
jgi:hypothetical protein